MEPISMRVVAVKRRLPECVLSFRLKVLAGDPEAEVIGQCFLSLIDLAPDESVAFVARFLESKKTRISALKR